MDVGAENKRMFEPPSPASRRFAAPETKRRFVPAESTSRAARLSDGDNDMAAALAQAEAAAKAEVEAVTQAATIDAIQSEVPETLEMPKVYTCDYGCGFVGIFEAVAGHEQECALNPECQPCSTSMPDERQDTGSGADTDASSSSGGAGGETTSAPRAEAAAERRESDSEHQEIKRERYTSEDDQDLDAQFELLGRHQEVDAATVEPEQESEQLKLSLEEPKAMPEPAQAQLVLEQESESQPETKAPADSAAMERFVETVSGLGLAPSTEACVAQLLHASRHKLEAQLQVAAEHHAKTLAAVVRRCKRRADDATLRALADDRLAATWRRAARLHSGQSFPSQLQSMSQPHQSFIDSGGLSVAVSRKLVTARRGTQPHIRAMAARGVFEDAESDGEDDESSSPAHSSEDDDRNSSARHALAHPRNTGTNPAKSTAQSTATTTAQRRNTHVHIRTMAQKGFSDSDSEGETDDSDALVS